MELPEILVIASLIVSVIFIIFGVFLIITRVFGFTSELLKVVEKDKNKEAEQIKSEAIQNAKKLIEEANLTSLNTIRTSTDKAQEIIRATEEVSEESHKEIQDATSKLLESHNQKLEEISSQLLTKYTESLEKEVSVDTETLNKIATSLEQKFQTQLDSFNADISKQLHELSTQLTKGIESKYEIVDKELLDYKNVKMKNIDDALHNILQEVSLAVLGKTMSFKDNEDYIEQILKEKFIQMR